MSGLLLTGPQRFTWMSNEVLQKSPFCSWKKMWRKYSYHWIFTPKPKVLRKLT
jgi:hypothetical protein